MKKIILISTIFTLLFITACTKTEENIIDKESNIDTVSNEQKQAEVPLPAGQDIVNLFFNLINEKRIPEAVAMMSAKANPDESSKQSWGVMFNAFESVKVTQIEEWTSEEWTGNKQIYKVTLETEMSHDSANEPIPYYGFDGKTNIRWIEIEKDVENIWKVNGISTGP